jgi:hypothetical protein
MKRLFILHHLGLGDHLICNGLYRVKLEEHKNCVFVVKRHNLATVREMLSDCPTALIIPAPSFIADRFQRILGKVFEILGWEILRLGFFGTNFLCPESNKRFDEQFYDQAGLPFATRWDRSIIPRSSNSEALTADEIRGLPKPFVFVHEDPNRGFIIDPGFINSGSLVVGPSLQAGRSFFSYCGLIETAVEVHLIGSSFLALAETLSLTGAKYVHNYARPDTAGDVRLRQSLKSEWTEV